MYITKVLGIQDLPIEAQRYMKLFLSLSMIISFLTGLSNTFYILFLIDQIGFALAGICSSAMLATQLIFDYPSGSLGDWIGQRWVLALAYIFYGFSFLYLTIASTFFDFILISMITGFGNAQASGTMETWVDNNYRVVVDEKDPEKKIYGFSRSRINSLNNFAFGLSFIIGGYMATLFSRRFVFLVQFGLTIIIILLILTFLKDVKRYKEESINSSDPIITQKNYFNFFKGGINFLFSSKEMFLFLVGIAIYNVAWVIWEILILFPLYFGYTGEDVFASFLRTAIFIFGIPLSFYMANIGKKLTNYKLPSILLLQVFIFFPGFLILTYFNPPNNEFDLIGIIATFILLWLTVGCLYEIGETLQQRILLDVVPSQNRNAVYSLIPTIISLIGIPILPIIGLIIEKMGLSFGIGATGLICFIGSLTISIGLYIRKKYE